MKIGFHTAVLLLLSLLPVLTNGEFPDRIVSDDGKQIQWSAKWPSDARVEFLGATNISLRMRCDFSSDPDVKWTRFCFVYRRPSRRYCAMVHRRSRRYVLEIGHVSVPLTFDPKLGSEALLEVPIGQELPLLYAFCEERTERGTMTSNRLFLLDLRKNFPKNMMIRRDGLELDRNTASILKCLEKPLNIDEKLQEPPPRFRQPRVPINFEWFFCSGDSLTACEATKKPLLELEKFTNWPAQVRADGELYVPFLPNKVAATLENKRLICFMMGKPIAFYKSPLKIVDKTSTLAMVRPKGSEEVILYDSADFIIRLPCEFNISLGQSAHVTWTFKNGSKTETLSPGSSRSDLGVTVSSDGSALIFKGLFSEATEGTYICTVTSYSSTVSGSYEIIYTGPPRLDPSVPQEKLMVEGGSVELLCKFQQPKRIYPHVAVCGEEIDLGTEGSAKTSMMQINNLRKTPVNFRIKPLPPSRGSVIRYTETDAKLDKNRSSSHNVTCIGYQNPFSIRKRTVFKTVPKPNVRLSCPLECRGSCDLKCEVTSREQIEAAGGEVLISWSLHNSNATASVPGTPIGNGSVFTYQPEEEGTQIVRCTAQLRVRSSDDVFFEAEKMSDPIRFVPKSSWPVIVIVVVLLVLLFIFIAIVILIVALSVRYRKRHRFKRNWPHRSPAEEKSLQNRNTADVGA